MTAPSVPAGSNLYSQGFGSTPSSSLNTSVIATRAPASTDIKGASGNYPIGQIWVDKLTPATYILNAITASNGIISAVWNLLSAGSGDLDTLTADTGSALPTAGAIAIVGGTGVTTSATGSTLTIDLTGGGVAIDSFTPDAGTDPVVPDGAGNVTMAGTAAQITTTGGTNSLTFSLPSAITAPGSLTTTTSLTATLGAITATNGNLVLGTAGNKILSTSVGTTTAAGANSFGTVTLTGGTATVATTAITTNSIVFLTRQTIGATGAAALGMLSRGAIVNGVSFDINALLTADATNLATTDVSNVGWFIVN